MNRFCVLAVLMLLGSPACAGESFSFVFGGHHIHIETSRNCRSSSCVSVSIPGVYEKHARRDRYDDDDNDTRPTPPPAQVAAPVAASPNPAPQVAPVVCAPAAAPVRPVAPPVVAAVQPQIQPQPVVVAVQPQLPPPPVQPAAIAAAPPPRPAPAVVAASIIPPPAITRPVEAALPPPVVELPKISKVVHREEPEPDSPIGDWQTEGHKGMVRIEACGRSLCGYVLDPATNAKGETVLIDMKSKETAQWSGNIYSRDSGNTYYATMTQKGPDQLQVEACAFGHFFCSGNAWIRIAKSDRLITYREIPAKPQS